MKSTKKAACHWSRRLNGKSEKSISLHAQMRRYRQVPQAAPRVFFVSANSASNRPISFAWFWIVSTNLSITVAFDASECCIGVESRSISPFPLITHSVLTFASAHTLATTSKDGLPCRVPTTFWITVGATAIALAKAALLPPYSTLISSMNRSFIVIFNKMRKGA